MSEIFKFDTAAEDNSKFQQVQLFPLVDSKDPILQEVLPEFDFSNTPVNPTTFASQLVETCKYHDGLGLSANQCGFRHRVFVMGAGDNYVAHFNPKVISVSENLVHMSEGCLSFPFLFLNITRPGTIQVEYQDYHGETKQATYSGVTARCFLHELDHLNGVVYTSKAKPLALKTGKQKRDKLLTRMKKANEKLATRTRTRLP
jgi:peptide deformylase